jgi:hypothetical protein
MIEKSESVILNQDATDQLVAQNKTLTDKVEILSGLVKTYDEQLTKYESIDIDSLDEELQAYSSLGTVSEIQSKLESAKADSKNEGEDMGEKTVEADSSECKTKLAECQAELDKVTKELEEIKSASGKSEASEIVNLIESATSKIESLLEYGTEAEITSKLESHETITSDLADATAKVESLDKELAPYKVLGNIEDITAVFESYESMKIESAAKDISSEVGCSFEVAEKTIRRFESIDEARTFLGEVIPSKSTTVAPKSESVIEEKTMDGSGKSTDAEDAEHMSKMESAEKGAEQIKRLASLTSKI